MKPTQAQLNYAAILGLDVLDGVTKQGLSTLLEDAIAARKCERNPDLPCEVAEAGVSGTSHHRLREIRMIRENGVRPGCIVSQCGVGRYVFLGHNGGDHLNVHTMEVETQRLIMLRGSNLILVYAPPTTHAHPFCAVPLPDGKRWSEHKSKMLKFIAFAESRLDSTQVFRNEHGTFWLLLAVGELLQQFAAASARHVPRKHLQAEPHFCSICGVQKHPRVLKRHRCFDCQEILLQTERYCIHCGTKFTGDGSKGPRAVICSACRRPKP